MTLLHLCWVNVLLLLVEVELLLQEVIVVRMQVLSLPTHVPLQQILAIPHLQLPRKCFLSEKRGMYLSIKRRNEARLSMLSLSSQPTQSTTPHYVAELTESQAFIADIPPLVIIHAENTETMHDILIFFTGTCSLQ